MADATKGNDRQEVKGRTQRGDESIEFTSIKRTKNCCRANVVARGSDAPRWPRRKFPRVGLFRNTQLPSTIIQRRALTRSLPADISNVSGKVCSSRDFAIESPPLDA